MDIYYRALFVLGYILLVPALAVCWYTGGRRLEGLQRRCLVVMGIAVVLILFASLPYR